MLVLVGILIAGNIVFRAEVYLYGGADYDIRIAIAAVVLFSLVGGRVPSFTRNWLARQDAGRLPVPFSPFDVATIAVSAIALALCVAFPERVSTGIAMMAAAGGVSDHADAEPGLLPGLDHRLTTILPTPSRIWR